MYMTFIEENEGPNDKVSQLLQGTTSLQSSVLHQAK